MSKPFCKDSKELDGSVFHCMLQGNNDDDDNDTDTGDGDDHYDSYADDELVIMIVDSYDEN